MRVEVIIVGAGKGARFGEVRPKQFSYLCKKPIFCWTIERFEKCELIDKIILVIPPRMKEYVQKSILSYSDYKKIKATVEGGKERGDSVFQGLQVVDRDTDIVLIHDGVRPLIFPELIERLIHQVEKYGAAILAVPMKETVKEVSRESAVAQTLDRKKLYSIQTPQGFKREIIWKAYQTASQSGQWASDDAALVEKIGKRVMIILGDEMNIKITTSLDLKLAEILLRNSV